MLISLGYVTHQIPPMALSLLLKPMLYQEIDCSNGCLGQLAMNYYLQIFTELESGHVFWFTFIDAGPRLILDKNLKKQKLRFQVANSVIGLGSRPVGLEDTYYHEGHTWAKPEYGGRVRVGLDMKWIPKSKRDCN